MIAEYSIIYEDEDEKQCDSWNYKHYTSAIYAFNCCIETIRQILINDYRKIKSGRDYFFKWRIWENKFKSIGVLELSTGKMLRFMTMEDIRNEINNMRV